MLFLSLIYYMGVSACFTPDTLREGTYKWVSGSTCCDSRTTILQIKRSHQTHYYLSISCFDRRGRRQRAASPCTANFLIDLQGDKGTVIQKSDPTLYADSFQIQTQDNLLWVRQFRKQESSKVEILEQQFHYVGDIEYPLFNMDCFNGYPYQPQFRDTVSINCYEYPDSNLCPRPFLFKAENWVVVREGLYEVQSQEESFWLLYFDMKPNSLFLGRYEDYNQHLWIRQKDFLKYFAPVKLGRIKGYNYPTRISD